MSEGRNVAIACAFNKGRSIKYVLAYKDEKKLGEVEFKVDSIISSNESGRFKTHKPTYVKENIFRPIRYLPIRTKTSKKAVERNKGPR